MADPPGWVWLRDGRRCQLAIPEARQIVLDVIELGADAAGWLAVAERQAREEARQVKARRDLQAALDRIRASPPSSRRPRRHLRAVR